MAIETGTRLGPYEIVSAIGAGGMGEVYRARDTRLDRSVALKVSKEAFSDRFEREARAVAALNHPHICTLYDVGPNYLVMELVDGVPLAGPLPVEKAVEYAGQILDALEAAHRQGIIHRDLKPANILVTKQGIKLLDFGLATKASPMGTSSDETVAALTQRGQIVGTLQYMAPEQLQGQPADARSDIFAFGCVLYELLSGKRAFDPSASSGSPRATSRGDGNSPAKIIAAILERQPTPLQQHPPLDRVIATCLAKDPDARFQTARDLKRALIWAMEPGAGGPGAAKEVAWWQRPAVVASLVGVVALIVGALGSSALRDVPVPPLVARFELPANAQSIVWSPDGTRLAWISAPANAGSGRIWVRRLGEFEARLLDTGEGRVKAITFSADGREVAFARGADDSVLISEIRRVPVEGGQSSRVTVVDLKTFLSEESLAWHADRIYLLAGGELQVVPAAGGSLRPLATMEEGRRPRGSVQVINDGRDVLFTADGPEHLELWTVPAAGGQARLVLNRVTDFAVSSTGHLVYTEVLSGDRMLLGRPFHSDSITVVGEPVPLLALAGDSNGFRVALSAQGTLAYPIRDVRRTEAVWVTRADGRVELVNAGLPRDAVHRLSADGTHIVSLGNRSLRAWNIEQQRGFQIVADVQPPFSLAAGTQAIFFDRNGAEGGIFRVDYPWTSPPVSVTRGEGMSLWGVSPDGRRLIVRLASETKVINADGTGSPKPIEDQPRFSPDGRWVAFPVTTRKGIAVVGPSELWVRPEPDVPNGRRLAAQFRGVNPFWSHRGNELFYLEGTSGWRSVTVRDGGSGAPVIGRPTEVAVPAGITPLALTPDGKRFLATRIVPAAPPKIAIVENFFEELRAKLPVK